MRVRIARISIANYKGARDVRITPSADRYLFLIGGENEEGKTSTMDAITVALRGAKAMDADPVTHGARHANIELELEGEDAGGPIKLLVERTIQPDGETELTVRDADGPMPRPQSILDRLFGACFIDPLKFITLNGKDQRAELMRVIPQADEIRKLDERRDRTFKQRTDVRRQLTMAEGEMQRLPASGEALKTIDVAALIAEQGAFADQQREGDNIANHRSQALARRKQAGDESDQAVQRVADLERKLEAAREFSILKVAAADAADAELRAAEQRLEQARAAWVACGPRRREVEQQMIAASEHNRLCGARDAALDRRAEVVAAVARLDGQVGELTASIESIDARKAAILDEAKLPVPGIDLVEDGIKVGGIPFAQISRAQKIRVALSIAGALQPGIDDIMVRDGAVLGDNALELIAEQARLTGKRVWIERVGTRDPEVIVIRGGKVVGA